MGYPTPIEWCDATWNPVGGCEVHSPGCINCYAQTIAASGRLREHPLYRGVTKTVKGKPVFNGVLTTLPNGHPAWEWPFRWGGAKEPKLGIGQPSLIFVADMSDLFHKRRDFLDIDSTLMPVVYSKHIGLLLSKRSDVMAAYFNSLKAGPNWQERRHHKYGRPSFDPAITSPEEAVRMKLWLGFSAERQPEMDERSEHLRTLAESGWQLFVSIEPMLGLVALPAWFARLKKKPWIIVGGESGPDARPMHPDWPRRLRDQAKEMGCPFFFKQHGEWGEVERDTPTRIVDWRSSPKPGSFGTVAEVGDRFISPTGHVVDSCDAAKPEVAYRLIRRFGKKSAGRLLDGVEHNDFPEVA